MGSELCGEEYVDWGVSARKPGRFWGEQQGTVSKCENTGAAENPGLAGTYSVEASMSLLSEMTTRTKQAANPW